MVRFTRSTNAVFTRPLSPSACNPARSCPHVPMTTRCVTRTIRLRRYAFLTVLSRQLASLEGGQVCDTRRMKAQADAAIYKRHRFPPAIIGHAVWLYFRFALSYRDVEELLAERGVSVTDETVRQWCRKFGQGYANELRRRRSRPGDTWHLDGLIAIPPF